jgi:hypothetical protein|uniref:Uncharacterized protein n=1 Tax=viral metagenome TaxID=1070528 RepID=A0A6C0JRN4_9ZZZZ
MSNICYICYNNKFCKNLKCNNCIEVICLDCCNKLKSRRTIYSENNIKIKFKCPNCRTNNEKEIETFDLNELQVIYKNNLIQYINAYNNNTFYEKEIEKLNECIHILINENIKIKKENLNLMENNINIINKNNDLNEQNDKLIDNTKKILDINNKNLKNYYNLLDRYKKHLKISV